MYVHISRITSFPLIWMLKTLSIATVIIIRFYFSWADAITHCSASGGRLAPITNPLIDTLVSSLMQAEDVNRAWVGAKQEEDNWKWISSK